jgi:tetratricopeptide (TPR) repeat protein
VIMLNISLALAVFASALAQVQSPHHTPGKMALDMNVECVSLLGENLYRTPAEGDALKKLEAALAEADKHAAAQPDNPAVHIARGQALAGLWRYHDAAQAYTRVIALATSDAEAFARRGNMFFLLRLFDQAKIDFEHATALAPQTAAHWIGVGMSDYLRGKYAEAEKAFAQAQQTAASDEEKTISGFWENLTQRRLGQPAAADAPMWPWMSDYAAGVDKLLAGDQPGALESLRQLADDSADWPMLPHIAAEAEIAAITGSKKMTSAR